MIKFMSNQSNITVCILYLSAALTIPETNKPVSPGYLAATSITYNGKRLRSFGIYCNKYNKFFINYSREYSNYSRILATIDVFT